uniref:DNA topoisomerase n=1 Tax=Albugo laibachii Nc14 TaxID=890382 RepID=F0WXN2_9STRA|nr:DNA topoisomerase putative [Albugo laibachii Nc14]|eukprot:CCA26226.1 DNA topoisomerase putative [Albugo laibachii Nc14]
MIGYLQFSSQSHVDNLNSSKRETSGMYVLNVAEKPSVAKEISSILSSGRSNKRSGQSKYNPIFEFPYEIRQQSVQMIFTSVIGHLMELNFTPNYRGWHSCDPYELFAAPIIKQTKNDPNQKKIEKTLQIEARKAQWLVLWLDCDREGENIAFEVKSICENVNSRLNIFRAKFSALIPHDIKNAVQNLGMLNQNLSLACDARSEIDLRIGAAFTRFQTMRLQQKFPGIQKDRGVISYGPCQFPTLGFVVERHLEIENFVREEFYHIVVVHSPSEPLDKRASTKFTWKRQRLYDRLSCLVIYELVLQNPIATINFVEKKATWKRKPLPLTTVELQKRASRWLRISSEETMKAAENLYNKGFISYPRTETSKFKEGTDLINLIKLHSNHSSWGRYVTEELIQGNKYERPRNGTTDDEAHPPIHPTKAAELNSLNEMAEKKVYELIVLHFLACCSKDAKGFQTNVTMQMHMEEFTTSGLMITERNYLEIYRFEKWSNSSIPVYALREQFIPNCIRMESGETTPPSLLTEADLIAKMDSNGIGTDATIAEHIKTILKREYAVKINGNMHFKPTQLGLALVQAYVQMGFDLAKPRLRAAMEADCKAISSGYKDPKTAIEACMQQVRPPRCFGTNLMDSFVDESDILKHTTNITSSISRALSSCGICDSKMILQQVQNRSTQLTCHTCCQTYFLPAAQQISAYNYKCPLCNFQVIEMIKAPGSKVFLCPKCFQPARASMDPTNIDIEALDALTTPCNRCTASSCPLAGDRTLSTRTFPENNDDDISHDSSSSSVPKCTNHHIPAVLRQVRREGPNKGRFFYVCSAPDQCDFFEWKDAASSISSGIKCPVHGEACAERTVKKNGPNVGRQFYTCARAPVDNCGFFEWKENVNVSSNAHTDQENVAPSTPRCHQHQIPCVLRTSCRAGANENRSFNACSLPPNQSCGFNGWSDEHNESRIEAASITNAVRRKQRNNALSSNGWIKWCMSDHGQQPSKSSAESSDVPNELPSMNGDCVEKPVSCSIASNLRKKPYKFTSYVKEDHGKALYCVSFCHVAETYDQVFAAAGGNRITVYECLPDGGLDVLQVYSDGDQEEQFFIIAWTIDMLGGSPLLAAAGYRGHIKVIDCVTQSILVVLSGHGNSVNELKFHPVDPSLLFSASKDESIRLWNTLTGVCVAIFAGHLGHRDEVLSLDVHLTGACFVSSGMDNTIKIWDLEDSVVQDAIVRSYKEPRPKDRPFDTKLIQFPAFATSRIHADYVDCVRLIGDLILSKSTENKVVFWKPNPSRGKDAVTILREFQHKDAELWFLKFGLDTQLEVLAVGNKKGVISIFDVDAESDRPIYKLSHSRCKSTIRQTCFSRKGNTMIACADDSVVWRWDLELENTKRSHDALLESTATASKLAKLDSRTTDASHKSEDRFRFGFHRIALNEETMSKRYFDRNANRENKKDAMSSISLSKWSLALADPNKSIKSVAKPTPMIRYATSATTGAGQSQHNKWGSIPNELNVSTTNENSANVESEGDVRKCITSRIRELLDKKLGAQWMDEMTALLQNRPKTSRYSRQHRVEGQMKLIEELKTALSTYCQVFENVNDILEDCSSKEMEEQVSSKTRVMELENKLLDADERTAAIAKKLQVYERQECLNASKFAEYDVKVKEFASNSKKHEQEKKELEISNQLLQTKMQACDHECEKLRLELKSLQVTLSDRDFLYEEKKKEMQHFYEKFDQAEEKKKSVELGELRERLDELLRKNASLTKEGENYKHQASIAEETVKNERERRAQAELDLCAVKTLQQSLDERLKSVTEESNEWKSKLKQKCEEMKHVIQSLTDTQKFVSSANAKLQTENEDLKTKNSTLTEDIARRTQAESEWLVQMNNYKRAVQEAIQSREEALVLADEQDRKCKELEIKYQESMRQLDMSAAVCDSLQSQLREMRTEHVAVNAQMEAVKSEMKQVELDRLNLKKMYEEIVASFDARVREAKALATEQVETLREAKVSLESEVQSLRSRATHVQDADLEELCKVKREAEVLRLRLREHSTQGSETLAEKDALINELHEKIRNGEKLRRSLHNVIQELRGNVRVYVRTRPFLPLEASQTASTAVISHHGDGESLTLLRPAKAQCGEEFDSYDFKFNRVFPPSVGQDSVFDHVSEFVQSSLDGYHVCLFSYGQTGSGKTHTMLGSGNGQMRGIIPRSIDKILDECHRLRSEGWIYTTKVSFMEIYNETIRDLLGSSKDASMKFSIRKDAHGSFSVPELTLEDVTVSSQVESLIERASRARSVAKTDMNAQSSRSHCIFTVYLHGEQTLKKISLDGRLHLVDLAGSERLSRSNASGARLKETQAINKSLSSLTNVFSAIANKSPHIPFRDSKLTFLLQNCLAGDGKTLMMVNLSPTMDSVQETLCSLRFAHKVNQCELGKAKRQIKKKV